MTNMQERQKRVKLELPVYVQRTAATDGQFHDTTGRLHDLSAGGCAFYHASDIPVGERIKVVVKLTQEMQERLHKSELTARGAVVRSVPEGSEHLVSVRFLPEHG